MPARLNPSALDRHFKIPPGLVLRDGGFVASTILRASETQVKVAGELGKIPFSAVQVARIICQPLSVSLASKIKPGRSGVLLVNGDFVEGEFRSLDTNKVEFSSVLFGRRTYDFKREVLVVALRDGRPETWNYELQLSDQTRLFVSNIRVSPGGITLLDSAFSQQTLPSSLVIQLKRHTDKTSFAEAAGLN
jgi:hypothetical protein